MNTATEPDTVRSSPRHGVLTVADQLTWSAANVATLIAAARVLPSDRFGVVAAAAVIFVVALAISRAFVTEPLILRSSDPARITAHRDGVGAVLGAALIAAPVFSLITLGLPLFVSSVDVATLATAYAASVMTLVQDATRYVAINGRRPGIALTSDFSWLALALLAIAAPGAFPITGPQDGLRLWLGGAALATGVALLLLRRRPLLRDGRVWLRRNARLARALAVDAVLLVGAANGSFLLVGLVDGSSSLAALRGAYLLLGPMNSFTQGIYVAAVPSLASRTARGEAIGRRIVVLTGGLTALWALFALVVLVLPEEALAELMGDTAALAQDVLPGLLLATIVGAVAIGAYFGVRAWRDASRLVRLRILLLPAYLLVLPGAAALGGPEAYAWALVVVMAVQAMVYWQAFLDADRGGTPWRLKARG